MSLYLIGYSTEDENLESEIQKWIHERIVYNFDDKMYIVKPDFGTEFIGDLQMMFLNRGKFFLTQWTESVVAEPRHLFPAPDKGV